MFYRQKIKKSVKAKDSYGPVLARVKTNNIMKIQNENENTDPPPPGGIYKYICISYIIIIFIYVIDLITMILLNQMNLLEEIIMLQLFLIILYKTTIW